MRVDLYRYMGVCFCVDILEYLDAQFSACVGVCVRATRLYGHPCGTAATGASYRSAGGVRAAARAWLRFGAIGQVRARRPQV